MAVRVWQALLEAGRAADIVPCGLGARDTLRLEAGMRLYGQDIDESTTVLEADLGWMVGWSKTGFIGHDALVRQRSEGAPRKLVGFVLIDRGIARHGYSVLAGRTRHLGVVTSGTQTPFLKRSIGLAYVPMELAEPGTEIGIDIRGRESRARVVELPFYRRAREARERVE
jgi:aminomethyltransferase